MKVRAEKNNRQRLFENYNTTKRIVDYTLENNP